MDSLKQAITLREIAGCIRRSYNALRNEVEQDPSNAARGTLKMQHASLPIFKIGRKWLARQEDLESLLNPSTPTTAPAQPADAETGKPRRGRPRKSQIIAGGAK